MTYEEDLQFQCFGECNGKLFTVTAEELNQAEGKSISVTCPDCGWKSKPMGIK